MHVRTEPNICTCICIQRHLKCSSALIRRMATREVGRSHLRPTKRHTCMTHRLGAGMTHRPTLQSCAFVNVHAYVRNRDCEDDSFFPSLPNLTEFLHGPPTPGLLFHRGIESVVKSKASYSLPSSVSEYFKYERMCTFVHRRVSRISYFLVSVSIFFYICHSIVYLYTFEVSTLRH